MALLFSIFIRIKEKPLPTIKLEVKMKYLSVTPIIYALNRIVEGGVTHEHRTSSATSALLNNYFPGNKFLITPEQIQEITKRRPDYTVEKVLDERTALTHLYVEVKSIVADANYDDMLEQVATTVGAAMEYANIESVYVIIMKATKIGFYIFHLKSELDEVGVPNYLGIIPLNFSISLPMLYDVNYGEMNLIEQLRYITASPELVVDPHILQRMGVESSAHISHPHI
jgi:hypothetical protein